MASSIWQARNLLSDVLYFQYHRIVFNWGYILFVDLVSVDSHILLNFTKCRHQSDRLQIKTLFSLQIATSCWATRKCQRTLSCIVQMDSVS